MLDEAVMRHKNHIQLISQPIISSLTSSQNALTFGGTFSHHPNTRRPHEDMACLMIPNIHVVIPGASLNRMSRQRDVSTTIIGQIKNRLRR